MGRIMLTPGSAGVAIKAVYLFGRERVEVGRWREPVWVNDLTEEEIQCARELFGELNTMVTVIKESS